MLHIVSIIGARPQFIKAAPICRALRETGHQEYLVHTGQHYDPEMSEVFFEELQLPTPDINLEVGSGSHGWQTGQMLMRIEEVLVAQKPNWVLIYGDTNSTIAGALAAVKLHIPVAHVEAGLRSFNRKMPEEHNRVVSDHLADLLLCPTQTAVNNLTREGIAQGVHLVGDVMYDSLRYNLRLAEQRSIILDTLRLQPKEYVLATVHRAENTDDPERLHAIFEAFIQITHDGLPVVIPLHPRTRKRLEELNLSFNKLQVLAPVSYLDMLMLAQNARMILTDSGGLQKEAYWLKVPCLTLREETEWVETVESGWNMLVGAQTETIIQSVHTFTSPETHLPFYGDGETAFRCVRLLEIQQ
ncbi:UDP-N-acetylglucosamine 2-epimerase [Candidatus Vecturithrix granuli]|uniref:UDP-N-acetylglucosamine 2-epimerase n=1 Tax=Vecturithrix granuli TaxID=1499967 RepID=A0A081C7W4_VECG1|nr:UDP-N-acetylglucosamine 2-epimerase [Candidatus Vecturithrix granuli]